MRSTSTPRFAQIEFRIAATNDQFSTIAKMRAARRLWARVAEACGAAADASAMQQHAVTSRAMLTQRDPWVNILRSTVACFAAGLGGADAITVLPFDDAIGLPDGFARRVARNTQAVLINEANIARVIDPGGGSWYIEALTDDFARAGWSWFQEIEAAGGWDAATASGLISAQIERARDKRAQNVARRRQLITGVTEFPDIDEAPPDAATMRRPPPSSATPRRSKRCATAATPRPPRVVDRRIFLANIGPIAAHAARHGVCADILRDRRHRGAGQRAPRRRRCGSRGVQRQRSDATPSSVRPTSSTRRHAVAVAEALRAAGAKRIYLAGNPGDNRERFTAAGIDEFIYVGCDALDALDRAVATLGVA